MLSIFEISTASANRPVAQLTEESIGRPGISDLPGVEVSERLAKSYDITETVEGDIKTRSISAVSVKADKSPRAAAPHIKESILCFSTDTDSKSSAGTLEFIHAEGIAQMLPEKYTDEEKEMIAYVVYAEARGEIFEGMVAVAQVIINRYESGKFGETIKSVVYSRHQFAVSKRYNDICMAAVEYAIDNTPYPKNMYYFQKSKRKEWYGMYFDRIGNHSFYCGKW